MTEDGFSFQLGTTDCSVVVSVHTGSQAHPTSCAADNTSACWLPVGVCSYRRFEVACGLILQYSLTLNMVGACCCKTFVIVYTSIRRHIPEDLNLQLYVYLPELFKTYELCGTLWTDYAVVRPICGSVSTCCMEQKPVTSIHTYLRVILIMCSVSLGFLIELKVLGMLCLSNFF
jgi:hypothetical protein